MNLKDFDSVLKEWRNPKLFKKDGGLSNFTLFQHTVLSQDD